MGTLLVSASQYQISSTTFTKHQPRSYDLFGTDRSDNVWAGSDVTVRYPSLRREEKATTKDDGEKLDSGDLFNKSLTCQHLFICYFSVH